MVELVVAKDAAVEIIVEVDVHVAMLEMAVLIEDQRHPMLDGVMIDNLILIVTNFFALTVGDRHTRDNC